jgi:hypothetical protein
MNQTSSRAQQLARRLVAHESGEYRTTGVRAQANFPACEKLRPPLAALVGSTGFSALLSRALALAGREVPWLRAVHVAADCSLEGMAELETHLSPEQISDGKVALLAQLLGLLSGFIGESLTMQLLSEAWPKLSLAGSGSMNGEGNDNDN